MNDIRYGLLAGVALGMLGGTFSSVAVIKSCSGIYHIPPTEAVTPGYVILGNLEIKSKDLDGNGTLETIVEYDGNSFLFTLDKNGNPRIQAYETKPATVTPAKVIPSADLPAEAVPK